MREGWARYLSGDAETRSEVTKFTVATAVLLGAVLLVALLRPLVFGRVVPALLGEGQRRAPMSIEVDGQPVKQDEVETMLEAAPPDQAVYPAPDAPLPGAAPEEAPTTAGAAPAADGTAEEAAPATELFIPAVPEAASETGAETVPLAPTAAEPAIGVVEHVIQPGEALITIAQQYGVTVAALMDANNIENPNRITAGEVLRIPVP